MVLLEGEPVFDLLERLLVPVEHLLGLLGQAVPDGEQLWNWLLAHMAALTGCETTTEKITLEVFELPNNGRPAEHVGTSSDLQPGSGEKGSAAPEGDESFSIILKITETWFTLTVQFLISRLNVRMENMKRQSNNYLG